MNSAGVLVSGLTTLTSAPAPRKAASITSNSISPDMTSPHQISTDALAHRLRLGSPPVTARIADQALTCDLRTVFPREDSQLAAALRSALGEA